MGTPLLDRINARQGCEACGGSRLSGTGHKIWCSGHILAPRPTAITERMSAFSRRLAEKRLSAKDYSNGSWTPNGSGDAA